MEGTQYGGGYSGQRKNIISMVEDIQYGCVAPSVQRRDIISATDSMQYGLVTSLVRMCHIFSMVEGVQYGHVTSSVQWRVYSTDLSHHQYGGRCAMQDCQNCSGGSW